MNYLFGVVALAGVLVMGVYASQFRNTHTDPSTETSVAVEERMQQQEKVQVQNQAEEYVVDPSDFVDVGALLPVTAQAVTNSSVTLNDIEIQWLLQMREEEKLAHDVYITLYTKWQVPVFKNISQSEQTHTDAVRDLLERYSIADPISDNTVGVFKSDRFTQLYASLVGQGEASLEQALVVGATIEDLDINDLQIAIQETDTTDIKLVYENLMKGSRNHLRAFNSQLEKRMNQTYIPQYISEDAFASIISSPQERGYRN